MANPQPQRPGQHSPPRYGTYFFLCAAAAFGASQTKGPMSVGGALVATALVTALNLLAIVFLFLWIRHLVRRARSRRRPPSLEIPKS
jgi:hypothetical protein